MSNPSSVLQVLKEQFSRVLQKDLPPQGLEKFAAAQQQQQHFWQRRFYDFNGLIRDRFDGARTRDQEVTATRRTKSPDPHPQTPRVRHPAGAPDGSRAFFARFLQASG
jgi:hypothetical protein